MSLVNPDIPSSKIFESMNASFQSLDEASKKKQLDAIKGIFELVVTNGQAKDTWTIDMKEQGKLVKGKLDKVKPNVTVTMPDEVFADLASGKQNPQKAFMTGKIKVKGNIMLATKLDSLLKLSKEQAKL